jgi:hypothetical protein
MGGGKGRHAAAWGGVWFRPVCGGPATVHTGGALTARTGERERPLMHGSRPTVGGRGRGEKQGAGAGPGKKDVGRVQRNRGIFDLFK